MAQITTKLTRLLGIHTPIVSAVMAGASGGALAAKVSLAGGFGFVAAGYDTPERFRSEINIVRSHFSSQNKQVLPIGVGFLGWQLDDESSHSATLLSIALENNVQAVWFAFGNNLHKWVEYVRKNDQSTGRKTVIFAQVSSVKEALLAVNEWKVDALVAQGIESGGHGASYALPLLTLVPSVLGVLPVDGPPLLAAGGLATGKQIASLLTLGAAGAVLGTRFLHSPESQYTDSQRHALLAAPSEAAVRTMAFDYARNTLGWPRGIDGRGLRNATVEEYEAGIDLGILRNRFTEALKTADTNRIVIWSGTGVGLINSIMPAKEIVEELHHECVEALSASSRLVASSS